MICGLEKFDIIACVCVCVCVISIFWFHLGGMVYDSAKKRGVKRKSISSPEDVELPFTTTYNDVLEKGRSLFSEDDDIPLGHLVIADSN